MYYNSWALVYCILCCIITGCAKPRESDHAESMRCDRSSLIIDKNGNCQPALRALLQRFDINFDGLTELVEKTQRTQGNGGWIRPQGSEAWELSELKVADHGWYLEQFKELGFIDKVLPYASTYDYILVYGATAQGMRARLKYLLEIIDLCNIKYKKIIFLVGQRPRNEVIETEELLKHPDSNLPQNMAWHYDGVIPRTETEMAQMIIAQTKLPHAIRKRILFIDTPMQQKADGSKVRPTTDDTVLAWLATNPLPGTVLCISSQPYIDRQLLVARRLLPDLFTVECVGPAENSTKARLAVLFDALARMLWEIKQMKKE
jgi:hypothetical protein